MIAKPGTPVCTPGQHQTILWYVRSGRSFELMEWVEQGLPVLIPELDVEHRQ